MTGRNQMREEEEETRAYEINQVINFSFIILNEHFNLN